MTATATVQESAPAIYRTAACALVAMFVVVAVQIAVFSISAPPTDPEGWLAVYADNPVLGFVNADGLYVLTNVLVFPMYVALWVRLRVSAPVVAGAGFVAAALSLAVYLPTNVSVELGIVASDAQGATGEAHTAAVGAVEALVARSVGTAFVAYYLLGAVAIGLFGFALRATGVWGRTAAIMALASAALMLVPSSFGTVGIVVSFVSLVPWMWFCVIAVRRLLRDGGAPVQERA